MKSMIGIVPLIDKERESYWMLPGYMEGIIAAGGTPVMLPLTKNEEILAQFVDKLDGFLFTGGQDVSPFVYGEEKLACCGECSKERDQMEALLLQMVLEKDKPALGICRGIQFINAFLGGTLYQDLPTQITSKEEHHQKPPYYIPSHNVSIKKDSPLYELLKKEQLAVNSYHHQAVNKVSDRLEVMATAPDGVVEAVYMPGKRFVWAVQWHPEFSYKTDEDSLKILRAFVGSATA